MTSPRQQMVDKYFERSRTAPLFLVVVAFMTWWLMAPFHPKGLVAWALALTVVSLARSALAYLAPLPARPRHLVAMRAHAWLTGWILGAGLMLIMLQCSPQQALTASLIGVGVLASAVHTMEIDFVSYAGYAPPMLLAMSCGQIFNTGWDAWPTALMFIPFGGFMTASAFSRFRDNAARYEALHTLERQATELQRANADLTHAREDVLHALETRQQFLANMSHEIRTPLNGVLGMVELVLADERNAERRELLEMAKGSARSLTELLGNILEFSRLDADRIDLEDVPFDLLPLLEGAIETVAQPAGAKGLRLALDVDPSNCPRLLGDPGRLRQILVNLLGNAIKFTADGEVALRAQVLRVDGARVRLVIQTEDTGLGIPAEKRDVIFEPFRQAEAGTSRRFGGSGLGLAISRLIARRMGGDLLLRERVGPGSLFVLVVEFAVDRTAPPAEDADLPLAGRSIVLCDPHPLSAAGLRRMLAGLGARVEVRDVPGAPPSAPPDDPADEALLVIDESLVEQAAPWPPSRMLAVNRIGQTETVLLTRRPLHRPVTPTRLAQRLAPAGRPAAEIVRTGALAPPLAGVRVLVAEDTTVNQVLFRRLLARWGAEVVIAATGVEALERVAERVPDIVLMDISMPDMDGLEATRRLRQRPSLRDLPVIALTAHAFREDHDRCLAAGCNAVITKPVVPEKMLAVIEDWLGAAVAD